MKLVEFSRKVEGSSEAAFRRLARDSDNAGVKRIFTGVADDEQALATKIAQLDAGQGTAAGTLERVGEEMAKLTKGLTAGQVRSDVEAYGFAAAFEERVCELFREAAAKETDPQTGSLLRRIGDLECGEAEELRRAQDFVNAPNEYLAWGEFSNLDEFHNFGRDVD